MPTGELVHAIPIPHHSHTTALLSPMVVVDGTLILASNHEEAGLRGAAGGGLHPAVLIDLSLGAIAGCIEIPGPVRAVAACGDRVAVGLRAAPWLQLL